MNHEELNQALNRLKTLLEIIEKREWAKGIRAGALAGVPAPFALHSAFQTNEIIDSKSAAELDTAADQWIGFLGEGA